MWGIHYEIFFFIIKSYFLNLILTFRNREELKEMKWESVGKVLKVMIYPIKSCAGKVVRAAQAKPLGLVNGTVRDRLVNRQYTFSGRRSMPEVF